MHYQQQVAILLAIAVVAVAMSVFVLVWNIRSVVNKSFALFLFGLGATIVGFAMLLQEYPFVVFDHTIHYGGLILLLGLLLFSRVFPSGTKIPPNTWLLCIPFVAVAAVIPFDLLIRGIVFTPAGEVVPLNGPLFVPYMLFWAAYVIIPLYFLRQTYKKSRGKERSQLQYLFVGLSVLLASFLIFNLILPLFGVARLFFVSGLLAIGFIALTSYAIVRHELLDIRIVIQRGLVYTILSAIVIGCYIMGLEVSAYFLHVLTEEGALISAGATTLLGVFFLAPIESYFRRKTDHVFFKDAYDYADALHALSRVTQTSLNRGDILAQSEDNLKRIFKIDSVRFVFDPSTVAAMTEKEQSAGFATIAQPIMFEKNAIGILKLGPKRSGDTYTKQDKQLLSTFALQAAVAIAKADLHAQVREYNEHLEALVDERTVEVKRMQEDQRETMIDISHNLQTPLAIIRGELEMLGETTEDSERIDTVRNSIDRVSGFIRQLLHLARLEHSLYTVERVPLDLSSLVREQVDYFEVMAEQQDVRIETSIQNGCRILGNKRLLEELFVNLVTNAMTYRSTDRPALIRIELKKEKGLVTVTVADNGIGIPEKDLPEIFLRFYRVPSEAHTLQGTGLGLAIVKNIVEKHQGSIRVESTLDVGTTFTVEFPVSKPKTH